MPALASDKIWTEWKILDAGYRNVDELPACHCVLSSTYTTLRLDTFSVRQSRSAIATCPDVHHVYPLYNEITVQELFTNIQKLNLQSQTNVPSTDDEIL